MKVLPTAPSASLRLAAALALLLAAAGAVYLRTDAAGPPALGALALHALLPLLALPLLLRGARPSLRSPAAVLAALALGAALLALSPAARGMRSVAVQGHAVLGLLALLCGAAAWVRPGEPGGRPRLAGLLLVLLAGLPAAFYAGAGERRWTPPAYDAERTFRFLTATTVEQAGEPSFPSALRLSGVPETCGSDGCHAGVHREGAHASAGSGAAYLATYRDFVRRRGSDAGRWCQGCHNPESQLGPTGAGTGGVRCGDCHGAEEVLALHGSAALRIRGGQGAEPAGWEVRLRPYGHRRRFLRDGMQRSPEFCAACHRKSYGLPQNEFDWMPGPDEYHEWQTSTASGQSLFAAGDAAPPRSCVDCHAPHGAPTPARPTPNAVTLDLFLRREGQPGRPAGEVGALRAGETVELDVVVRNSRVGHDFPYGMPDQQESWLEVAAEDARGRPLARTAPGDTAVYSLVALDRAGKPVVHGDLDRMVAVREWRRIPFAESDLARCRLRVPAGLARVRLRLLRRLRPELARWAGLAPAPPALLAEAVAAGPGAEAGDRAARYRSYGRALARARLYPEAIAALNESLRHSPRDGETLLALGQVYFAEGDLLAAGDRFREAAAYVPDRARAWEGAVLRRSGQPQAALDVLRPLSRRFPRDLRLRYELGLALMELLRHEEAAREFQALLGIDPLDVSGHFNLMRCWQRLNRLPDARREEALYTLLSRGSQAGETPAETAAPSTLRIYDLR